jgi:hypothetical protein
MDLKLYGLLNYHVVLASFVVDVVWFYFIFAESVLLSEPVNIADLSRSCAVAKLSLEPPKDLLEQGNCPVCIGWDIYCLFIPW